MLLLSYLLKIMSIIKSVEEKDIVIVHTHI